MCTKMFIFMLYFILLSMISMTHGKVEQKINSVNHPVLAKLVKMRCTRRFSPGVCADEVAPVWTFVFLAQNCTERLGCPNNYRTNRFRSYRMCMKRCRALVSIYLQMVEFDEKNNTTDGNDNVNEDLMAIEDEISDDSGNDNKEENDDKNLREGLAKYFSGGNKELTLDMEDLTDLEEEEYKDTDQRTHFIVYKDVSAHDEIMPPDIDYVAGEIRSELDLLHG